MTEKLFKQVVAEGNTLSLEGTSLRLVALFFATWKTYRTAATGDETMRLATRIEKYIKTGETVSK